MLGSTEPVQVEAKRVAVAGDRYGMHASGPSRDGGRSSALTSVPDITGDPRIEAHRGDDAFAVLQLELLLDRFAVPGRRRHVDEPASCTRRRSSRRTRTIARVLPAKAASTESPSRSRVVDRSFTSFCRFTQPSRDTITTLSSSTMKSSAVYSGSPESLAMAVRRLSPYLLLHFFELAADQLPAALFVLEQSRRSGARACRFSSSSFRMIRISSRASAVDLELEDRVGLVGVELEPLHDLLGGVGLAVGLANQLDDLVERVEDLLEALEDVDPLLEGGELVLEPLGHDFEAEVQEVPQDLLQIEALGPADFRILGRE